jgi:hypothetical protein
MRIGASFYWNRSFGIRIVRMEPNTGPMPGITNASFQQCRAIYHEPRTELRRNGC